MGGRCILGEYQASSLSTLAAAIPRSRRYRYYLSGEAPVCAAGGANQARRGTTSLSYSLGAPTVRLPKPGGSTPIKKTLGRCEVPRSRDPVSIRLGEESARPAGIHQQTSSARLIIRIIV